MEFFLHIWIARAVERVVANQDRKVSRERPYNLLLHCDGVDVARVTFKIREQSQLCLTDVDWFSRAQWDLVLRLGMKLAQQKLRILLKRRHDMLVAQEGA
ncbi:MAG: hypothetical protein IID48_17780 [Proteobacteria bacterium]|nr:hypothetical protein [Pseudomonadota bacterium]